MSGFCFNLYSSMAKKITVLGIIPARGGSKGIPYKNIAPIAGKPLIYYTIREAKKSKWLDACVVSTDDEKIAAVAKSLGADVPFLRPKKYARDKSPDIEFLRHAVGWLEKHRGWKPEIIVILQPTSPTRSAEDIDNVIKFMIDQNCDSVRTVIDPSPFNPFKMWTIIDFKTGKMKPLLPTKLYKKLGTDVPRQLLPNYYLQVGLVYATRSKFIKQGKVWGPDVRGYVIDAKKFTDIDTTEYLKRAERALKELKLI